jgi:hypothetical protein
LFAPVDEWQSRKRKRQLFTLPTPIVIPALAQWVTLFIDRKSLFVSLRRQSVKKRFAFSAF